MILFDHECGFIVEACDLNIGLSCFFTLIRFLGFIASFASLLCVILAMLDPERSFGSNLRIYYGRISLINREL